VAANLLMVGATKGYALELESGTEASLEALEVSRLIGDYRSEILARNAACANLTERGQFDAASEHAGMAHEIAHENGVGAMVTGALRHHSSACLAAGQLGKAIELAERCWRLVSENHFEAFMGPSCLGVIARSAPQTSRQDWAIDEGFRLLSQGAVSHNHLFFHRYIMEVGLDRYDWELLQRGCDGLAAYTRAEPLPLSGFFIARAQTLRNFYQGHDREKSIENLLKLKDQAEQAELKIALPRIDAALGETG
jgi:hypothetical protein